MKIAVIGGSNGGFATAADLALAGHPVRLWTRTAATFGPLHDDPTIKLVAEGRQGSARLERATTDIAEALEGAEVLIVRSTKVTRAMLEAGHLSLVVRAGAGYNTIDVEAASERGIYVANCPGKNSIAVAELAFGLILALDRRIADNAADLKRGVWNKKEYSKARGLYGRTLGVIGSHHIGASTDQAQEAVAAETVRIIQSFKDSGKVPNAVNLT